MEISATQLQQKAPHLIHKTYYKNFFLLRTEIVVNGQQAQVDINEEGWLTLNCRNPKVGVTFDSLVTDVNEVLQQHGLHGVSNYWCEEVPLFELKGTSQEELEKLLGLEGKIKEQLALKIYKRMKDEHPTAPGSSSDLHVLVHPQLYLLIPDYAHMDGRPIHINKGNFSECMALFGESRLFDFGAVFRALRANQSKKDTGPDNFHDLLDDFCEVVGWYRLGQALRISEYQLQIIKQDNQRDTEMCRTKMLSWWWENAEERKWSILIHALARTGSHGLASKLALKHGVSIPHRMQANAASAHNVDQAHSSGLVDLLDVLATKLRNDIDNQDQDLARQDQSFLLAEQERDTALRRMETLEHQLSVSQSQVTQLIKEKEDTASTLRRREFEFQLLRRSATDQIELQQQSIYYKEKEIADLRVRLQSVESELAETKLWIPALKEDLQTATLELKKKEVEVEVLQETKNDMRLLLDMEKRVLDNYLLQLTAASISHDQYRQEVEMQLHCLKKMSGTSVREMKAFHKYLEKRDPEIKKVLRQISTENKKATTSTQELPGKEQNTLPVPSAESTREPAEAKKEGGLVEAHEKEGGLVEVHKETGEDTTDDGETGQPSNQLRYLVWEKRRMAPQVMARGSAAVHGYTVFLIGENSNTIHSYSMAKNEWNTLPVACPHTNPGLTFVENVLTAVGGQLKGQSTKKVMNWRNEKWRKEIPPMQYPHSSPSVLNMADSYIIVAGGAENNEKSVIEIFSLQTKTWVKVLSLPMPLYGITTTLYCNDYIVMDGCGSTHSMDIPNLLSSTVHPWKNLPHVPSVVGETTVTTFRGQLTCICSDGIYQLSEDCVWKRLQDNYSFFSWSKCIACVAGHSLVVVGGYHPYSDCATSATNEVNVAHYLELDSHNRLYRSV